MDNTTCEMTGLFVRFINELKVERPMKVIAMNSSPEGCDFLVIRNTGRFEWHDIKTVYEAYSREVG